MRRAAACLRALCLLLQLRASGQRGRPGRGGGSRGEGGGHRFEPAGAPVVAAAAAAGAGSAPAPAPASVSTADSGRRESPALRAPRSGPGDRVGLGQRNQKSWLSIPFSSFFFQKKKNKKKINKIITRGGGVATCVRSRQQGFWKGKFQLRQQAFRLERG